MKPDQKYEEYKILMGRIADLDFSNAVLGWDQQVYMPKNGAEGRGRQMATLSTLSHELFTSEKLENLLRSLSEDQSLDDKKRFNVQRTLKDVTRKKKYSEAFVSEMALTTSKAFGAWSEARVKRDFKIFEPLLSKIVELKRKEAEFLGYEEHPYNALVEDYEPGLRVAKIDAVFDQVKRELFPFTREVTARFKPDTAFLSKAYPKGRQWEFSKRIIEMMGYDFESGRADDAPHPFCTTFAPGDVRITIRSAENEFNMMLFAAIHEAGHALYELGLPQEEHYGLPLGGALSMAFHESQSRFWENSIGRSLSFWKGQYPALQKLFPENLSSVSLHDFYRGVNAVEPSFIRVEADELTYHAHIYIRYLIEKALMAREIEVKDVPAFWNERYQEYLGIRPSHDGEGCLQDVHWSYGSFGYFPTYSFGSFYAAQLHAAMRKDLPDFEGRVERGEFASILKWLREKVHVHGKRHSSDELLTKVTGEGLNVSHFMGYVREKYGALG
ncbi:MAG: carboxypeptidase M32 [Bdellovibrionales bacterium]|nr:carboxypeptidase M32 [Bdellovibrionales bacterium]